LGRPTAQEVLDFVKNIDDEDSARVFLQIGSHVSMVSSLSGTFKNDIGSADQSFFANLCQNR
jgi:hypothetical protein